MYVVLPIHICIYAFRSHTTSSIRYKTNPLLFVAIVVMAGTITTIHYFFPGCLLFLTRPRRCASWCDKPKIKMLLRPRKKRIKKVHYIQWKMMMQGTITESHSIYSINLKLSGKFEVGEKEKCITSSCSNANDNTKYAKRSSYCKCC